MIQKYLPIGTIVLLKGGKKRLMITGYCFKQNENSDKVFDYVGCLYPEGMLTLDSAFGFDHAQIEAIFAMGFIDEEEKNFVSKIDDMLKETKQNINNNSNNMQNNSQNS